MKKIIFLVLIAVMFVSVIFSVQNVSASVLVPDSIAVTTPATKLTYNAGDSLDISGLVVTGTYSGDDSIFTQIETITEANVSGFDSTVPVVGQVLTVSFGGKTTTYTVDIIAIPTLNGISATSTKLTFNVGESFSTTGLVVTGTYSGDDSIFTQIETITEANVSGFDSTVPVVGQVLTISFGGKTTTYTVDIVDQVSPVITINGESSVRILRGSTYTDAGATVVDDVDSGVVATSTSNVNTSVNGTYYVTYGATDASGNSAIEKTRTVVVYSSGVRGNNGSTTGQVLGMSTGPEDEEATTTDEVTTGGTGTSTPTATEPIIEKPAPVGQVLGVSDFVFNIDLRFGDENNDVKELQIRLTAEGVYTGPVTGYFGPLTLKAVKAYQARENLPTTGFVGPMTRGVLNSSDAPATPTLSNASNKELIDLFILLGIITPDKADAARKALGL